MQDEYVDFYQAAVTKYTQEISWTNDKWVKKEYALIKAGEDVVMRLGRRTLTILKKYGFINEHMILEDFCQSNTKFRSLTEGQHTPMKEIIIISLLNRNRKQNLRK